MFTGIIETLGTVESRTPVAAGLTLCVRSSLAPSLKPGDSVSVNGVCQTVEKIDADVFEFTAVGETLKKTTLGELDSGAAVNLEPAATPQTALGGHIVQGHVDGVGTVESFEPDGQDWLLKVRVPGSVHECAVDKGSITIDGVSLTVIDVLADETITITIIPFTREHTIVEHYKNGTRVNVEADIIGKYLKKYVERMHGGAG